MKWFDRWFYTKVRDTWDNKHRYEELLEESNYKKRTAQKMNTLSIGSAQVVDRGSVEGEDRVTFELTSAVGGRILNVRRYDQKQDRHNTQTYVIPSGEDVGSRVAKIVNLELLK